MHEPFSWIKVSLIVASILWGIASLRYLRPSATPMERFTAFFISACWTYYTTPILHKFIEAYSSITADGMEGVIGFTLGIFYIQIIDILQHLFVRYKSDPKQAIADLVNFKKQ